MVCVYKYTHLKKYCATCLYYIQYRDKIFTFTSVFEKINANSLLQLYITELASKSIASNQKLIFDRNGT